MTEAVAEMLEAARVLNPTLFHDFDRRGLPLDELARLGGFRRVVSAYLTEDDAYRGWGIDDRAAWRTEGLLHRLLFLHNKARDPLFGLEWEREQKKAMAYWEAKRQDLVEMLSQGEELIASGNEFIGGLAPAFQQEALPIEAAIARIRGLCASAPLDRIFCNADVWKAMRLRPSAVRTGGRAADPKYASGTLLDTFARDLDEIVPQCAQDRRAAICDLVNFVVAKRPGDGDEYTEHKTNLKKVGQALDVVDRFPGG